MTLSKNTIAGFLMGVSAGVVVGYFLKTADESFDSTEDHEKKIDAGAEQPAKGVPDIARVNWEEGQAPKVLARVS